MASTLMYNKSFNGYELLYYLIFTDCTNGYGVGIKSCGRIKEKFAAYYNLTSSRKEALNFLKFLNDTDSFPTALNDMVEDWMFD